MEVYDNPEPWCDRGFYGSGGRCGMFGGGRGGGGGSSFGIGLPRGGKNGRGLIGVYYDWITGTYRSTSNLNEVGGPNIRACDALFGLSGKNAQNYVRARMSEPNTIRTKPNVTLNTSSLLAKPASGQKVQGLVAGFEFNFIFVSVSIGVVRLVNDNETRGISFSVQDGPGFNLSANVFTGVIWSKKDLNYSDLEGRGVCYEVGFDYKGYGIGGSYGSNSPTAPLYNIVTVSSGFGYTKRSGNLMETNTTIIQFNAINCEHCY